MAGNIQLHNADQVKEYPKMTTITHDLGHGMGNDWEYKDWAHLTV